MTRLDRDSMLLLWCCHAIIPLYYRCVIVIYRCQRKSRSKKSKSFNMQGKRQYNNIYRVV
jgi:hypothetical protein